MTGLTPIPRRKHLGINVATASALQLSRLVRTPSLRSHLHALGMQEVCWAGDGLVA